MSRVAITVSKQGVGPTARMDPRFGRAECFQIFDGNTKEMLVCLHNANCNAAQGAGTGSATLMKEQAVDAVISGTFGPKAFEALGALGIEAWIAPPGLSSGEALDAFLAGSLERMAMKVYR
jgi:predicted Fe-Mo cluster-binding NifX family protein